MNIDGARRVAAEQPETARRLILKLCDEIEALRKGDAETLHTIDRMLQTNAAGRFARIEDLIETESGYKEMFR